MVDGEPPSLGRLLLEVAQAHLARDGDVLRLADVIAFVLERVGR